MEIFIKKNSQLPIYEQITEQVKNQISEGLLKPGVSGTLYACFGKNTGY